MKKLVENRSLKKFACDSNLSRGRIYDDESLQFNRTEYQRDRDRILHSEAFRRLKQKTQVFVKFQNDHVRTRLTHTLEVAQLARSISRYLHVNDDLSEAIALAHDLGHPPYGHAGEDALSELMKEFDGFNHNEQTIRIVTSLEKEYFQFKGLNLTYETLEGLMKHNGPFNKGKLIPKTIKKLDEKYNFNLSKFPTIEAQIANICDDIAYVSHDLNDGLNNCLLKVNEIESLPIIGSIIKKNYKKFNKKNSKIFINQITRNLINFFVNDIVKTSIMILDENKFQNVKDIQDFNSLVIRMDDNTYKNLIEIKHFLLNKMYKSDQILKELSEVNNKIKRMFKFFFENPLKLPKGWHYLEDEYILNLNGFEKSRIISDYISGMTDTYFDLKFNFLNLD